MLEICQEIKSLNSSVLVTSFPYNLTIALIHLTEVSYLHKNLKINDILFPQNCHEFPKCVHKLIQAWFDQITLSEKFGI